MQNCWKSILQDRLVIKGPLSQWREKQKKEPGFAGICLGFCTAQFFLYDLNEGKKRMLNELKLDTDVEGEGNRLGGQTWN